MLVVEWRDVSRTKAQQLLYDPQPEQLRNGLLHINVSWQSHRKDMVVQVLASHSSDCASPIVFVGTNRAGNWVVREQRGAFGGLFISRSEALKYALFKNGRHPESIIEVTREIELDIPSP